MREHQHWMQLAIIVARQALPQDVPVGCIVVKNGQLIGSACNRREQDGNPSAHAEVLALAQAAKYTGDWRLSGCKVYVTLEPCPMCASLLQQARVDSVVYGTADVLQGACGSHTRLWQGNTLAGIEEAACQQLLDEFFKTRRQVVP
jgi:tRNA(adenine34) deaminase